MATKTRTARRRAAVDPFATEASLQALLRFGPEESALSSLADSAKSQYETTTKQAAGAAAGSVAAIDRATPVLKQVYDDAGAAQANTARTLIGSDLAGLSGVANSIRAGAASEQAQQLNALQQSKASAMSDLLTRRVAAVGGRQYAEANARNQLAGDLAKILQRRQDLEGEKGAFTALTRAQLSDAADKLASTEAIAQARLDQQDRTSQRSAAQSERNSERSAGIDPDSGSPIPNGPLDPNAKPKNGKPTGAGGVPLQTQSAQSRTASDIQAIYARAHNLQAQFAKSGKTLTRAKLVNLLSTDRPADTSAKRAAVKGFSPDLRMTAALDQLLYQGLSPATQRALQAQGFSIDSLGVTSVGERRKRTARSNPANTALATAVETANRLSGRR